MKRISRSALAGGAVVVLGVGALALRGEDAGAREAAAAVPEAVAVERRDLEVRAEAAGLVEPVRTVEVKSKASGEVLRVHVETGDYVEQGALLAEVDPRDVQNALDQAAAELESARVTLSTAAAQRQRMESLRQSGVVTQQEYESAVQAAASARTAVVRAETNHQLARERSRDVTIRAPISGTIIARAVEPGQIIASATSNVSGGSTLFTMADLSEIQVRAKVDETDIGQVRAGQPARVSVEAYPGRAFSGRVLKVEPQAVVEQNVTMFPVLVRLPNPDGLLKPGMNAEVALEVARRDDAVAVPNTALSTPRDAGTAAAALGLDADSVRASLRAAGGSRAAAGAGGGASVVFVRTAAGIEPRRVRTGVSDWEYTEVSEGLKPGERVVPVAGAQLQQKQTEAADRMRQRAGGVVPGAGGGGPRGG